VATRKGRRRDAQIGFEALSIEGGLLSADWLARVAQLSAGVQGEADYNIPRGLNLRDEIGRYWRIAQAHWNDFTTGRTGGADPKALAERFILALLRESFGFSSLKPVAPVIVGDRSYPIGYGALGNHIPVVIAPAAFGLDTLGPSGPDGGRRRTAFGLAQEFLNEAHLAMWGLASDGITLRILRDNASLTRPAWIEADLSRIFTEELYSDFAALWLLAHETRFGRVDAPVYECALETWRTAGREEGTRAREFLRRGVEDALVALGQGFLAHPGNQALRAALHSGELTAKEYFNQLLRLVYRMIFLLTVEERGLLHSEGLPDSARALYEGGYGLRRLRDRSAKRSGYDRFSDLWEGTKIVFRGVATGEARLALPALAGIFSKTQCPALDVAKLENRALLLAVFRLSWLREESGLARINWRDMGPEELGSVYESLLELVPQIAEDGRRFGFAAGAEAKGNARKTTGSYYTPDSLVQVLLDSTLEPVITDAITKYPSEPVEALLKISILDPACGSGHFLLSAARRLAAHVARLRSGGTPSPAQYRHALREVVARCVFGVDVNPMAVELCKVSLWMEALEPGLPLTFLDAHIQRGNSLLGVTPGIMDRGIPDAAWDPIEGDDRKTAAILKNRNRHEADEAQRSLLPASPLSPSELTGLVAALEAAPDRDAHSLAQKESQWGGILESSTYREQKFVADAWCAAFVWPKEPGALAAAAPTNRIWREIRDRSAEPSAVTRKTLEELASQYGFFHWPLAFPQVFARGGFDVVLGNPPWDSLLFSDEEFFAASSPAIAKAPTSAVRKRLIAKLEQEDPALFRSYQAALRLVAGANAFVRSGVRYPLCGLGRVNLFALFAETARALVSSSGRFGQVLPSGIVTDDSTKLFFQALVESGQLRTFLDFENREALFPAVHRSFKFGLLSASGAGAGTSPAEFVFFATRVEHLRDPDRRFSLSAQDIALLNPATKTCPIFRFRRDAEITKAIYRRLPVLVSSGWKLSLRRLLNQSDDSGLFETEAADGRLPLYEGKYFHHYDHRWVTNESGGDRELTPAERAEPTCFVNPRYWYPEEDALRRFGSDWKHSWLLAWRDITNSTNERSFIASVIPSLALTHTAKAIFAVESQVARLPMLVANLGSLAFDFVARQKIGGTHMANFIVEQLPVVPPEMAAATPRWEARSFEEWLLPRVLELIYTAWDLEPFARDIGHEGPPFRWDDLRRSLIRCELDAAFLHLYELSRDDADYILESFPIVRRKDEATWGEYRTKRVILEIYDAMQKAMRSGEPYQTTLDPPPADPRVVHPPRRSPRR